VNRISNPPPVTPDCRDPFDQPFLQLAAAGKADYLVKRNQKALDHHVPAGLAMTAQRAIAKSP